MRSFLIKSSSILDKNDFVSAFTGLNFADASLDLLTFFIKLRNTGSNGQGLCYKNIKIIFYRIVLAGIKVIS